MAGGGYNRFNSPALSQDQSCGMHNVPGDHHRAVNLPRWFLRITDIPPNNVTGPARNISALTYERTTKTLLQEWHKLVEFTQEVHESCSSVPGVSYSQWRRDGEEGARGHSPPAALSRGRHFEGRKYGILKIGRFWQIDVCITEQVGS